MKRDEMVLAPEVRAPGAEPAVRREPLYLPPGTPQAHRALFAWYHAAPAAAARDAVAVICPPVGSEYTRSHRSLRHLADRLARAGIPALRFDYDGIGDSPGDDLDAARLAAWTASVQSAIAHARRLAGCARVCLVGVRLGATLAALAAREAGVEHLVLWEPCVKGRRYVRELQALAASAERAASDLPGAIESAGFVTTGETLDGLRGLDLAREDLRVRGRVLLAQRDDLAGDPALPARLVACGVPHDVLRLPGWAGMMAEHQFTVVPDAALDAIVAWIARQAPARPGRCAPAGGGESGPVAVAPGVEEMACRFGADGHLFGILARPTGAAGDDARPAIVLCNAGAAHHVGPNRLYVTLARRLAALGFASLRFDLESLGDSVNRVSARENYPYPHQATGDTRSAIEHLRDRHGYRRFVPLGLCSGAHTVFHAGLELADLPIAEVVLVNPMQFYWEEGMSLDTSRRFEDMVQYRKSMRDPRRWLKLLRGDVDFRRLFEVALAWPGTVARTYGDALRELVLPHAGPRLARDLKALFAMGRPMALYVSEGDPGRDVLMAGAKLTATRAIRRGDIRLEIIPGADHTFSQWKPRNDLLARLAAHLERTHGGAVLQEDRRDPTAP